MAKNLAEFKQLRYSAGGKKKHSEVRYFQTWPRTAFSQGWADSSFTDGQLHTSL